MDSINLPSTFYRVTIKAIVRDERDRLLVGKVSDGTWEVPGGGWEHNETFEQCIHREVSEELGSEVTRVGQILFTYVSPPRKYATMLRLATDVELANFDFKLGDLIEAKFVTKEELLELPFVSSEAGIKDCVDMLWSQAKG